MGCLNLYNSPYTNVHFLPVTATCHNPAILNGLTVSSGIIELIVFIYGAGGGGGGGGGGGNT